jgi:hypothetical protein
MFRFLSEDYIRFLRNHIVNVCYNSYCFHVFDHLACNDIACLLNNKDNVDVWGTIFDENKNTKLCLLLQYYVHVCLSYYDNDHLAIKNLHERVVSVFPQKTFQDYIDGGFVSLEPEHDTIFGKYMEHDNYKNKMIGKYERNELETHIKNYLIYVFQLYLLDRHFSDKFVYFSQEEIAAKDVALDLMPLFHYMSNNYWVFPEDISTDELTDVEEIQLKNLEKKVLLEVYKSLF